MVRCQMSDVRWSDVRWSDVRWQMAARAQNMRMRVEARAVFRMFLETRINDTRLRMIANSKSPLYCNVAAMLYQILWALFLSDPEKKNTRDLRIVEVGRNHGRVRGRQRRHRERVRHAGGGGDDERDGEARDERRARRGHACLNGQSGAKSLSLPITGPGAARPNLEFRPFITIPSAIFSCRHSRHQNPRSQLIVLLVVEKNAASFESEQC
jgi:hypothetical protein